MDPPLPSVTLNAEQYAGALLDALLDAPSESLGHVTGRNARRERSKSCGSSAKTARRN